MKEPLAWQEGSDYVYVEASRCQEGEDIWGCGCVRFGYAKSLKKYFKSFKTIIKSHCCKEDPYCLFHEREMDDTVLLFAFNTELPETDRQKRTETAKYSQGEPFQQS